MRPQPRGSDVPTIGQGGRMGLVLECGQLGVLPRGSIWI